jgi:hypothetical protein
MLSNETLNDNLNELNLFQRVLMSIIFGCICIIGIIGKFIFLIKIYLYLSFQKRKFNCSYCCYKKTKL